MRVLGSGTPMVLVYSVVVTGVAAGRWAGLRQAIAFADGAAGLLQPELGRRALHRRHAAGGNLQVLPVDGVEVGWLARPLNSVLTAGKLWMGAWTAP